MGAKRGGTCRPQAIAHDPDGVLTAIPDAAARRRRIGEEGGQVRPNCAAGSVKVRRHTNWRCDHPRRHHVQSATTTAPTSSAAHVH